MSPTQSFLTYWYFHIPNLALAALVYTLLGRYVLGLFFKADSEAVMLKVFRSITDPILNGVRAITPAVVPNGLVLVFAVLWLIALRMFWFLTCVAAGMKLTAGS